jgi:hypothetical protein
MIVMRVPLEFRPHTPALPGHIAAATCAQPHFKVPVSQPSRLQWRAASAIPPVNARELTYERAPSFIPTCRLTEGAPTAPR